MGFARPTAGGLVLRVRVTPNAAADRIEGAATRDDGEEVLRLRVRAIAEGGKANAATLALLAKALGVPKSALAVTAGHTARLKLVAVAGDPARLAAALAELAR